MEKMWDLDIVNENEKVLMQKIIWNYKMKLMNKKVINSSIEEKTFIIKHLQW